jgi:two-component system OmpR family response regulator
MNILLVEDDAGVCSSIIKILKDVPTSLVRVPTWNGMETTLQLQRFDLILLDLGLPDSGTEETLSKIKDLKMRYPATSVCVITGQPSQNAETAKEAGADTFLHKTEVFEPHRLISVISALFSRGSKASKNLDAQTELLKQAVPAVIDEMNKP